MPAFLVVAVFRLNEETCAQQEVKGERANERKIYITLFLLTFDSSSKNFSFSPDDILLSISSLSAFFAAICVAKNSLSLFGVEAADVS